MEHRIEHRSSLSSRLFRLRCLLIAAAILHICLSLAVFLVGKYQLSPAQIYPTGIGRFASDGLLYEQQVAELSRVLKSEGIRYWANWPTQLHVRLYALPLALVSRWFSFNILTIEPLNLIYYLAIVFFVYRVGERVFGHQPGLFAAATVALWPSFLLHTTQLLRDPLLILSVLVVVWVLVQLILDDIYWQRMLLLGLAYTVALIAIRIVRLPMWRVLVVSVAVGIIFFGVRSLQQRRLSKIGITFALLMVTALVIIPRFQPYFHNQQVLGRPRSINPEAEDKLPLDEQVFHRREAFNLRIDGEGLEPTAESDSRLDTEVQLNSSSAIVRHVPRALEIGLFAPFPNMWFQNGNQVGQSGRLVAGFETLLTYVIESMAVIGLWWQRKNLVAWLLAIVIGLGAVALGLAVNNMGALYRLRYPFWVLMVILGCGGASFLYHRFKDSKSNTFQAEKSPL